MIAILLTHCAVPPQKSNNQNIFNAKEHTIPAWERHHAALKELDHWHAKGRLAASNGKNGGSASFDWQQMQQNYNIKFIGALGAGSAILTGRPNLVTLQDSRGRLHQGKTPETLMNYLAGWHIPLTGLQYWVLGMPMPAQATTILNVDSNGKLITLSQLGWRIEYSDYDLQHIIALPGKITLVNNQLKVKLVIKEWHT